MTRFSNKQYGRRVDVAMAIYVVLLLTLLPYAALRRICRCRLLYALLPLVPMFYVIWLMAKRIWQSDELEQRLHLIGLGVATAVVAVFSLVSGFLARRQSAVTGSAAMILIWIFPILMLVYGAVRAGRRVVTAARRFARTTAYRCICVSSSLPDY